MKIEKEANLPPGLLFELDCEIEEGNSIKVVFNTNRRFRDWFKKIHGLGRWSEKKFHSVIESSVEDRLSKARLKRPDVTIQFVSKLIEF